MKLVAFLAGIALLPIAAGAASSDPVAQWFDAGRCAAFNAETLSDKAPFAKRDPQDLSPDPVGNFPSYVYDSKSHSALYHTNTDSGGHATLRTVGPPPNGVPGADLSKMHTTSGIKLGTSATTVVSLLGMPHIIWGCGLKRYIYLTNRQAEPTALEFTISKERVVEIYEEFGG